MSPNLIGKHVRITFGQHYRQTGKVAAVYPKDAVRRQDMAMVKLNDAVRRQDMAMVKLNDAVRRQDMAMVKLNDGRIVSGVPVKDLEVCG